MDFKNSIKKTCHKLVTLQHRGRKDKKREKVVQAQKEGTQTFFVSKPEIKLLSGIFLTTRKCSSCAFYTHSFCCLKAKY